MKQISEHLTHYIPLLGVFAASVLGFMIFAFDRSFQMVIVVSAAAAYITWGIVHHVYHKDLSVFIVSEYVSLALLGVITAYTFIF
jgi:hypothetical protein